MNKILLILTVLLSGCATDYCLKKNMKHWDIDNGSITADFWCNQTMQNNECVVDPICANTFHEANQ